MEVHTDVIVNIPPNWQPIFFLNGSILVLNKHPSDEVLVIDKGLKIQAEVTPDCGQGKEGDRSQKEIEKVWL